MREPTPEQRGRTPREDMTTIDLEHETLLPIREVPRKLPPNSDGKRIHISAVYRWMKAGVAGAKLEWVKVGGTRYTSREALQRFAERRHGRDAEGPPLMSKRRQARIDAAAAEADRILNRR